MSISQLVLRSPSLARHGGRELGSAFLRRRIDSLSWDLEKHVDTVSIKSA